jgi:hypothetical protein
VNTPQSRGQAEPRPVARAVLQRLQRWGKAVGVAALIVSVAGAFIDHRQFFRSYLVAYLLWLGIVLGCLGMGLISYVTGGAWAAAIRDVVVAGAGTLPLLAGLFVPVAIGVPDLYVWAQPNAAPLDPALPHQQIYLNVPFFLVRAALFLVTWIVVGLLMSRWSDPGAHGLDDTLTWRPDRRLRCFGAGGLILVGLTVSFAVIDWVMSLEPTWSSSIFPAMVAAGHLLVGFSLVILVVSRLGDGELFPSTALSHVLNDLGDLLLALVMLWAYLSFSQFLLIWVGNLNVEIPWYLHRLSDGWQWLGIAIIGSQFVIPFGALLSRDVKRSARAMSLLAGLLIVGRLLELIWLVEPSFPPVALPAHWLDLTTVIGIGGIWLAAFAGQLRHRLEEVAHA